MNTTAVSIGLIYGVMAAVVCYIVSMITSGLFTRSFYRLYARVLIGICSVMLLAPILRWLSGAYPEFAAFGLTLAQYAVMAAMAYGVFRFNRDYMKTLFLDRNATAYFTFGTLANAAIVTLACLHFAVTGTPSWHENGQGQIGVAHYGPLLVLLAAMIFHTDYHLKKSVEDLRRFSRFTFVGYAVSFLGLALSVVPYLGKSLGELGVVTSDSPLLQNFFSAQSLLIAIILYAWLVWRYESIPPLLLMLLAVVGEYHVLVTQWLIQAFGPASWGLASLPLFAGIAFLNHYFANWDQRKQKSAGESGTEPPHAAVSLRFITPFRIVEVGLASALLSITLWTWLNALSASTDTWLTATFSVYACFFAGMAIVRKEPGFVYVSGSLAALTALLGPASPGGSISMATLGVIAALWGALALLGSSGGLKHQWRTPLADCSLISACLVTVMVFSRHLLGQHPYHFDTVGLLNTAGLGFAAIAFLICAYQYRSNLPVYAALLAIATAIPPWCAALGLLATMAAALIERKVRKENAIVLEDRVSPFEIVELPLGEVLPELYTRPLSMGAIPLAVIGLLISASHVFQANFSATVLIGAVISAVVLTLLTRSYRMPWLYVLSLAATYFAVHTVAHGVFLQYWPATEAVSAHLLVAATISLLGWLLATAYASWYGSLLKRVSEDQEVEIREKRSYHAGLLYDMASVMGFATLIGIFITWLGNEAISTLASIFLFAAAAVTSAIFFQAASVYRSQLGSYLSLTAITIAVMNAPVIFDLGHWDMAAAAGIGLLAAASSCLTQGRRFAAVSRTDDDSFWKPPLVYLKATGTELWFGPLGVYALACSLVAVLGESRLVGGGWTVINGPTSATAVTFAAAGGAFLLSTRAFRTPAIYVTGISLIYAAAHAITTLTFAPEAFAGQTQLVHLLVATGLSLVACLVAAACASAINRRLRNADDQRRVLLLRNRAFFAGILQHFAFVASCIILLVLASSVITDNVANTSAASLSIFVSLLLAATFSLSGAIYRSRIQTYCVLAATSLGFYAAMTLLVPEAWRETYQTLSVSASALLFGMIAWLLVRLDRNQGPEAITDGRRWYDCWDKPPLPLVSTDRSLWARPLAHMSVCLAYLAIGQDWVLHAGPRAPSWLTVTPIYLAAATFLVATRTHGFGWLLPWFASIAGVSEQTKRRQAAYEAERGIHYVISLITGALAIHLTVQIFALESMPNRLALGWHLCLGALLALAGWSFATLCISLHGRRREATPGCLQSQRELAMYGGLLHHVSAIAAVVVFAIACGSGVPPRYLLIPLLGSISLLTFYFGLASVTYRSQVASYLSLFALGLATLHLASIAALSFPTMIPLDAPAIALLGLVLVLLASFAAAWNKAHSAESPKASPQPSPWLRPLSFNAESLLATWTRPLRVASLFYATVGMIMMVAHRWFLYGSWDEANGQALITYGCVAVTFALASRLCDSALLTYGAATVVTFSAVPQLLIAGLPMSHLGIALSLVALLFWIAGFVFERHCIGHHRAGRKLLAASLTRVYERPLIRCSAVLAVIAIAHSLLVWKADGWSVSQTPIVVACALGTVTLLLNARSLNVLHRVTRARMLVYLACASLTGCSLAVTSMAGSFDGLGPVAAITALVLGGVGLGLIESSQAITKSKARRELTFRAAETQGTFGEPISHFAAGLSIFAVVVALIAVLGSRVGSYDLLQTPAALAASDSRSLLLAAATLLISAAVCLLTVRAQKQINWLYASVILGTAGLCLLAESQTDWTRGTMTVATLVLMNLLVALARIIRANPAPVESFLRLTGSNYERPFFQWPLVVSMGVLIVQSIYVAYSLTGLTATAFQWPWLWISLLIGGLFLHMLCLQTHPAYVHLFVWTTIVGVLGACISTDMALTRDESVVAVGFGWVALALGFFTSDRISRWRGAIETSDPLFTGIGNSIITILYLLISGVVIAPVVLSTPAPSVALSIALISVCWLWMAWVSGEEVLSYAALIGVFATVVYSGHALLGIPIVGNSLAAFFVVGYSFLLYGVNVVASRAAESKAKVLIRPSYYMALLLPISLIVAIPLDQRTPAAFALLAAGSFYLLIARQSQIRWPLYVAAILVNFAIYLWVPAAHDLTNLYQLYVIPAAITVLIFAQLHRHELNAEVLTSIRLAAAGSILAVSTYEVFFSQDPSLLQFVAVLLLSLAGTAAGIALRIKPFVYTGIAFMVINVVGQLGLHFHREGGVIRAIILIAVGLLILSAMIFFNIHRERILRQYRGFVADKHWE